MEKQKKFTEKQKKDFQEKNKLHDKKTLTDTEKAALKKARADQGKKVIEIYKQKMAAIKDLHPQDYKKKALYMQLERNIKTIKKELGIK